MRLSYHRTKQSISCCFRFLIWQMDMFYVLIYNLFKKKYDLRVVAVAVKWPEPEFTCQFNGSTTVQRKSAWVRETSQGLRGAEFCGLVAGVVVVLYQHWTAIRSHETWKNKYNLVEELTKQKPTITLKLSLFLPLYTPYSTYMYLHKTHKHTSYVHTPCATLDRIFTTLNNKLI